MAWSEVTSIDNTWSLQFLNAYVTPGYWVTGYTENDGIAWNEASAQDDTWQQETDSNNTWTEVTQNQNNWV
jgi:hypothetical protein